MQNELKVSLLYYTGKETPDQMWYAARLLAFTKATRLKMTPEGFGDFMIDMTIGKLKDELAYMAGTIASSWEMVDVMFSISNVSRACAQQMTRTRQASFAMQSQRVTDMSEVTYHVPDGISNNQYPVVKETYEKAMAASKIAYKYLMDSGASLEDARGVLPMNVHCNLVAKYNLRAWVDLVRARDSLRVQGEYVSVIRAMKEEVLKAWPWVEVFLEPKMGRAIRELETMASGMPTEAKTKLAKIADLLKKESA